MEKRNIDSTRQSILNAAERLMTSCSDPSEVTSRAITKEAGVNLAMINYCFGSREALLFEVYNRLMNDAQQIDPSFAEIMKSAASPKDKLIGLHIRSISLMLKHFNFTKAITKYVLLNREIGASRGSLPFIIAHYSGKKSENECRLIAYQISSLHELAVLRHEELRDTCGIDLTDENELVRFVTDNINRFLD